MIGVAAFRIWAQIRLGAAVEGENVGTGQLAGFDDVYGGGRAGRRFRVGTTKAGWPSLSCVCCAFCGTETHRLGRAGAPHDSLHIHREARQRVGGSASASGQRQTKKPSCTFTSLRCSNLRLLEPPNFKKHTHLKHLKKHTCKNNIATHI